MFKKKSKKESNIDEIMDHMKILDCTLRDGGLCLEDMEKFDFFEEFNNQQKNDIVNLLNKSEIDIIELGSIEITKNDKKKFAIYQSIEEASNSIKEMSDRYTILYRGPDTPINVIPYWNSSLIKKVRVIIRYSELQKSIDFCSSLSQKGYEVFIQPMVTLRYTEDEITYMIKSANDMHAYALYFVDSYGCMNYSDVDRLFTMYNSGLDKNIYIGFHAHNNMNMAFANVQRFIESAKKYKRRIIIDSTCLGMGQGAGNLQTELIIPHINEIYNKNYDYDKILSVCDILSGYNKESLWGYSLCRLLPALYKTAYKYAVTMRLQYNMSFVEINKILRTMPDNLRQRYTKENLLLLLDKHKK